MLYSLDKVAQVMVWGCVSCVLAALLGLLGLANFWMAFWGAWLLSAGSHLLLASLIVSTSRSHLLLASLTVSSSGRAVLVTSCDSGIGHALALHLDTLGFRVFAGCLLAEARGQGADRLRRVGSSRLHVLQLDVSKQEQLDFALRTVRNTLIDGEMLWGLVNNAELSTYGAVEWVPMNTYRKLMDVNLLGTVATTKTFLPLLRKARGSDLQTEEEEEEAIRREAQQMWTAMEEEVRTAYGAGHFDHVVNTRVDGGKSQLTDLSSVVEVLTEALTQKFPRYRYVCASLSLIFMIFVAEHFPEWVFDWIYVESRRI